MVMAASYHLRMWPAGTVVYLGAVKPSTRVGDVPGWLLG
jgi:hypothetical protein